MWKQKLRLTTLLYFVIRYPVIARLLFYIFHTNDQVCTCPIINVHSNIFFLQYVIDLTLDSALIKIPGVRHC